jgi:hypothetical protein
LALEKRDGFAFGQRLKREEILHRGSQAGKGSKDIKHGKLHQAGRGILAPLGRPEIRWAAADRSLPSHHAVKYLIENESSSKLIHESIQQVKIADLLKERRSES